MVSNRVLKSVVASLGSDTGGMGASPERGSDTGGMGALDGEVAEYQATYAMKLACEKTAISGLAMVGAAFRP